MWQHSFSYAILTAYELRIIETKIIHTLREGETYITHVHPCLQIRHFLAL